jgi:hypothetical protein
MHDFSSGVPAAPIADNLLFSSSYGFPIVAPILWLPPPPSYYYNGIQLNTSSFFCRGGATATL